VTRTRDVYGWVTAQRWVDGHYETRAREVAVQTVSGYTASRQVSYSVWEVRRSATPDFYSNQVFKTLRDGVRNPQAVYTTTTKQVSLTTVQNYTAYRLYNYSGTGYSFLPWDNKRVPVRVVPKNGYATAARLEVSVDGGVLAGLDSPWVNLASASTATLNLVPVRASTHTVTVKAYDDNGRLAETRSYTLNLSESLPSGTYSETLSGTTETEPPIGPPRVTVSESARDIVVQELQSMPLLGNGALCVDTSWHISFHATKGTLWQTESELLLKTGDTNTSWTKAPENTWGHIYYVEIPPDKLSLP